MATQTINVGGSGPNNEVMIHVTYDDVTLKTTSVRVVNATPSAAMPAHTCRIRVVDGNRTFDRTFQPGTDTTINLPNNIFLARSGAEDNFAIYIPYDFRIDTIPV